jgi:hypothetical protein
MDKKDFLFKYVEPAIRAKIKMDGEAMFSVTDQYTADKISLEIRKRIPDTVTSITDATACVGGNTMSFAKNFAKVAAIELDIMRYSYLKFNITLLGLANVIAYHGNALEVCETLDACDVLFLDPPWGGPLYKSKDKLMLFLSEQPLWDVCRKLASKCKYLAIKVPLNFDLVAFNEHVASFMERIPSPTKFRKIQLLLYKISIT